jgi:hypothetical protein
LTRQANHRHSGIIEQPDRIVAPSTGQRFCYDGAVLNSGGFGHLTRGANQGHIDIIANIIEPAPETAAGFFMSKTITRRFQFIETVSPNFPQLVGRSKTV